MIVSSDDQVQNVGIVFKPETSLQIQQKIKNIFCRQKSFIWRRNLTKYIEILREVQQWHINDLFFIKSQIHPSISEIKFPHLFVLHLNQLEIYSIEFLQRMWIPMIKNLSITKTKVTRLSALRKLRIPDLERLSFDKNYLLDSEKINELQFGKSMKNLGLEDYYPQSNIQSNSINWLSKLNAINLVCLNIRSSERIMEKSLETLQKKFNEQSFAIYTRKNIGFMISDGETSSDSVQ